MKGRQRTRRCQATKRSVLLGSASASAFFTAKVSLSEQSPSLSAGGKPQLSATSINKDTRKSESSGYRIRRNISTKDRKKLKNNYLKFFSLPDWPNSWSLPRPDCSASPQPAADRRIATEINPWQPASDAATAALRKNPPRLVTAQNADKTNLQSPSKPATRSFRAGFEGPAAGLKSLKERFLLFSALSPSW